MKKLQERMHFANFFIAGFNYYDGCMAWEELKVGAKLELVRDEYNKVDVNAVAIYCNDWKLGYVPAQENEMLAKFLDMGYDDVFDVRVQRLNEDAHPANQVGVIVYIKRNKNKEE